MKTPWHEEAVPKSCLDLAAILRRFKWIDQFYLAGGTALTLYYGHRISVDLDFFSALNPLKENDRRAILDDLQPYHVVVEQQSDGTMNLVCKKTHLSFFIYPYAPLRKTRVWNGMALADPLDIGVMKLGAVLSRGTKKDFYDLYKIMSEGLSLEVLLKYGKKKFKLSEDFGLQVCQAMVYFDDVEKTADPKMIDKTSWFQVRFFLEKEVRRVMRVLQ